MKSYVYAVKDNLSGFGKPLIYDNDQLALRDFAYGVNQPGLLQFKPEDYSLWKLGEYDSDTAVIKTFDKEIIVEASTVISKEVK